MKYLALIPTIYILLDCVQLFVWADKSKKDYEYLEGILGLFTKEELEELEKEKAISIRETRKMNITNNIIMFWLIFITCVVIMFWDVESFKILTRVNLLFLYIGMGLTILSKRKRGVLE